jgi:hypothetical protein
MERETRLASSLRPSEIYGLYFTHETGTDSFLDLLGRPVKDGNNIVPSSPTECSGQILRLNGAGDPGAPNRQRSSLRMESAHQIPLVVGEPVQSRAGF